MRCLALLTATAFLGWVFAGMASAGEPPGIQNRQPIQFFETEIRPILANHCFKCHGSEQQKAGLRLDTRSGLLTGGQSGPAVVPGKTEESLLIEAVHHDPFGIQMPPAGKLPQKHITALTHWVKMGAPWPNSEVEPRPAAGPKITEHDQAFWSFQPVVRPAVPNLQQDNWSQTAIDSFVLGRLRRVGLEPASQADSRQLIRRVYFDLTGLPPPREEVEQFAQDPSPAAYARLVDRLLESPQYGERYASLWLDLVRYAESDGFRQDAFRPHAWRYRDYVIDSFNADKPYHQFVLEQLAGDEIAPDDPQAIVATGYLRGGIYEYNQRDVRTQWNDILNDVTDTTADVFLGLGMGCARCHDHKFDPILQKDYYALQAFLAPMIWREDVPAASGQQRREYQRRFAAWEEKTAEIRTKIAQIEQPFRTQAIESSVVKFPDDVEAMIRKDPSQRQPLEHQLAELGYRQIEGSLKALKVSKKLKGEKKTEYERLLKELAQFDQDKPPPLPVAYSVTDVGDQAPATVIPGNQQADPVEPAFLTVLGGPAPKIQPPAGRANTTGRRTALARWIADPDNPLSTRVIVNRIWQWHFGQGLVSTSSDFGRLGEPPSHPELLDWLTAEFIESGWRLKHLHRLILTSAVYQQNALRPAPELARQIDPHNRLLWRMNTRRLQAEQIRDAMLAVSGELQQDLGGPSVAPETPKRSVYTKMIRNTKDPLLDVFDFPGRFASTPLRNTTTTPTQALLMINGSWTLKRAAALAGRLQRELEISPRLPWSARERNELISRAFTHCYSRQPTAAERRLAAGFLTKQEAADQKAFGSIPFAISALPGRDSADLGVLIQGGPQAPVVRVPNSPRFPSGDLTLEAFFRLDSLYKDAAVRTIVSQWDSNTKHPGWSLGITSEKSGYRPRNLIVQFVGEDRQGQQAYEVLASNLHIELGKPYYAAVSIRLEDTSPAGVTFFLQRLDGDHPLQTAQVTHKIVRGYRSQVPVTIGGRHRSARHQWKGVIDDVRISQAALSADQLLIRESQLPSANQPEAKASPTVGFWRFGEGRDFFADSSGCGHTISSSQSPKNAPQLALIDFCHVLLNSNEFLYVD